MKTTILLATLLLLTGMAAAQDAEVNPDNVNPSVIGPDSAFYPAQVALDTVLNTPAENAVKRAKDAQLAADRGNYEASDRALKQLSKEAGKAEGTDENKEYLDHAQKTINEIESNKHAEKGLDTASEMISEAKNRQPIENGEKGSGFVDDLRSQAGESAKDVAGNRP